LVIGGTGSIGQALIERILTENPAVIRVYSRDEYKQFLLAEKFRENANIRYLIGDVRDEDRLDRAMNDIDIVFNLAALNTYLHVSTTRLRLSGPMLSEARML